MQTGPSSVEKNVSASFTASGAVSNLGHPVQFQFFWGDGTDSGWGGPTQSHTWIAPEAYSVMVQARCQDDPGIMSGMSGGFAVAVTEPQLPTYTLNVTYDPAGGSVNHPASAMYNSGDLVTLTASPFTGFIFTGWTGAVIDTASQIEIIMDLDKYVMANFAP